jgi:hypothetical protein
MARIVFGYGTQKVSFLYSKCHPKQILEPLKDIKESSLFQKKDWQQEEMVVQWIRLQHEGHYDNYLVKKGCCTFGVKFSTE